MSFSKDRQDPVADSEWQWEPFIRRILEGDVEHFDFQVSSQEVQNSVSSWTDKDLGLNTSSQESCSSDTNSRSGVRCTLFKDSCQMEQQGTRMEEELEPSKLMSSQRSSQGGGIKLHCGLDDSSRGSDEVTYPSVGNDRLERTSATTTTDVLVSNTSPAAVQHHHDHGKLESFAKDHKYDKLGNQDERDGKTGVDFRGSQATVAVMQSGTLKSEEQGRFRDSTDDSSCDIIDAAAKDFNEATEKLQLSFTESSCSLDRSSAKKHMVGCNIANKVDDAANCQGLIVGDVTESGAIPKEETVHCNATAEQARDDRIGDAQKEEKLLSVGTGNCGVTADSATRKEFVDKKHSKEKNSVLCDATGHQNTDITGEKDGSRPVDFEHHSSIPNAMATNKGHSIAENSWCPHIVSVRKLDNQVVVQAADIKKGPDYTDAVLPVRNPDTDEISTDGGTDDDDAADDLEDKSDATDDLEDRKNVISCILDRDFPFSTLVQSFESQQTAYSQPGSRNQPGQMSTDLASEHLQQESAIRTSSREKQEKDVKLEVHSPDTIPSLDFCVVEASTGNCLYKRCSGPSTEDENESEACIHKAEDAPGDEDSGIVNATHQDAEMEQSDDAEFVTALTTMSTSTPVSATSPLQLFKTCQDHNFKPMLIKSFTSDAGYSEQACSESPKEVGPSCLNLLKSVVLSIEDGYPTESSKDDSQDLSEDSKSLNAGSDTDFNTDGLTNREFKSTFSDAQNPAVNTKKMKVRSKKESSSPATTTQQKDLKEHCFTNPTSEGVTERGDVTPKDRETTGNPSLAKAVSDPELQDLLDVKPSKDDSGGKNRIKHLIDSMKKQKLLQSKKGQSLTIRRGPVTKWVESVDCITRTRVHNHEVELSKEFSHSKSDSTETVLQDPLKEWMHSLAHVQIHCDYVPHKMLVSVKEQNINSKEAAHDYGSFSLSCEDVSCSGVPVKKSLWAPTRLMVDDANDMLVHHTAFVETPATYGFSLFHGILLPCVLYEKDKFYVYKHIEDCYIKDLSGKKRSPRWALRKFNLSPSSFLDLAGLNAEMQSMHVYMGPGNFKVIKEDSAETICEHHKVWKTLYRDDKPLQTIKAATWAPRLPSTQPSVENSVQCSLDSDSASKQHDVKDASLSLLELSQSHRGPRPQTSLAGEKCIEQRSSTSTRATETIATHDAVPVNSVPVDLSKESSTVCARDQQNTGTTQTNCDSSEDSETMLVDVDNTDESSSDLSTDTNHYDTVAPNKPDIQVSTTSVETDGSLSCQKATSGTAPSTTTSQPPSRSTVDSLKFTRGQQEAGSGHATSGEVTVVTKEANNTPSVYSSSQLAEKNPAMTELVTSPTSLPSSSSSKTFLRSQSGHYVLVGPRADPLKIKPLSCRQMNPKFKPLAPTTSCQEAIRKYLSTVRYQFPGLESSLYSSTYFKPPILPRVSDTVVVEQRPTSADGTCKTVVLRKVPKYDFSRSTEGVPVSSKAPAQTNMEALVGQGAENDEISLVVKKKTIEKLSEGLPLVNTASSSDTTAAPVLQQQQSPKSPASNPNPSNITGTKGSTREEPLNLCCHKRKTQTLEKESGEPLPKHKKALIDQLERAANGSPRKDDAPNAIMVQAEACVHTAFAQAHKELQSVEKEITEVREELVQTRCERINLETRLKKLQQLAAARKNIGCQGKIRL